MNKKAIIILGFALIFGAVTAVLINRVLQGQAELNAMGKTEKILVAVNSISMGQQIEPTFVKLQDRGNFTVGTMEKLLRDCFERVEGDYAGVGRCAGDLFSQPGWLAQLHCGGGPDGACSHD